MVHNCNTSDNFLAKSTTENQFLENKEMIIIICFQNNILEAVTFLYNNKPAAQAAGADPPLQ